MFKKLMRFMSDVCWAMKAEQLALKFLLISLETTNVIAPTISLQNSPPCGRCPTFPYDLKVVYENKEALNEIRHLNTNDVLIPRCPNDIN